MLKKMIEIFIIASSILFVCIGCYLVQYLEQATFETGTMLLLVGSYNLLSRLAPNE